MDQKDIQIYCDLCKTHNITETSKNLFMAQSAITRRIQKLEQELDVVLFERGKGKVGVDLTEKGRRFTPIAEQWLALDEKAHSLKNDEPRVRISYGGVDSVTCHLLPRFFEQYVAHHDNVDLNLYTLNTWDVYTHLESGTIDVGVTHVNISDTAPEERRMARDVELCSMFKEPYVVLRRTEPGQDDGAAEQQPLDPKDLSMPDEIYAEFDSGLRCWHLKTWPDQRPRIYSMGGVALIIPQLLGSPKGWSIVPLSVARSLCSRHPLTWHPIQGDGPSRTCCVGINRRMDTHKAEVIHSFRQELTEFLQNSNLEMV